jgi:hypothetical protein
MHVEVSRSGQKLKIFQDDGSEIFSCETRNATVNSGEGQYGQCPLGDYLLGSPESIQPPEVPFGFAFTPILDINGLWNLHHRAGLGVHGGGSGLPDPFAPQQGWVETEGCWRLQNVDNQAFVTIVRHAQLTKQTVRFTVTA